MGVSVSVHTFNATSLIAAGHITMGTVANVLLGIAFRIWHMTWTGTADNVAQFVDLVEEKKKDWTLDDRNG